MTDKSPSTPPPGGPHGGTSQAGSTATAMAPSATIAAEIGSADIRAAQQFIDRDDPPPMNPIDLLLRLMRDRWISTLALGGLVGLLFAAIAFLMVYPVYQSEGLVRIIAREPKILFADRDDSRLRLFDAFVAGEATYMQSRAVMDRAFAIFEQKRRQKGEYPDFRSFYESLSIKKLKGLINVSAQSKDPSRAQDSVNALLSGYSEMHDEQAGRRQSLRSVELETRIQELLARRARLDQKLLAIGEEYDASALAKAHLSKVTQLEEIDGRLAEVSNSIARMEASSTALDADTGDMEIKRATLLDRAMADMVFERAKRAAELEQMSLRYQKQHPKVARLRAALAVIDDAIENRRRLIATLGKTGAITGGDGASASQSLAELTALRDKLSKRRQDLSVEAKNLNSKLIQLAAVNAERGEIGTMLADTRRVLDQVRLESRNSLPGTADILSRGSFPLSPASNKRKALMMVALIMGGGLVFVARLMTAFLQARLRYSDDLSALAGLYPPLVAGHQPDAQHRCFQSLWAELHFDPLWRRDRANIFAVTRLLEDSHLALNGLGEAAADMGLRVLIINRQFAPNIKRVSAPDSPMQKGQVDVLFLSERQLTALSASQAAQSLEAFIGQYDLILLDSGARFETATSITLNQIADGCLMFAAAGSEKRCIKRYLARFPEARPIFLNARSDDPGLRHPLRPATTGDLYHEAA